MAEQVKKKSKAIWITAGIGCLALLCIFVIIAAAAFYFISNNPANEAKKLISDGNTKYNSALKSLEEINPLMEEFSKGNNDNKTIKLSVEASVIIKQANKDLESSKASFEKIAELKVNSKITEKGSLGAGAVDEMQRGVNQYGKWIEDAAVKLDFLDKFVEAYNKSHLARKELYTAINANNNNNKQRTLLYAQRAQLHYKDAKTLASEANKVMQDPSNDALIKSDSFMSKCADYAIELGKIGRTGNTAKYNATRDKYEVNRKAGQALFSKIVLIDKKDEWIKQNITDTTKGFMDLIDSAEKMMKESDSIKI